MVEVSLQTIADLGNRQTDPGGESRAHLVVGPLKSLQKDRQLSMTALNQGIHKRLNRRRLRADFIALSLGRKVAFKLRSTMCYLTTSTAFFSLTFIAEKPTQPLSVNARTLALKHISGSSTAWSITQENC
jgi:hypothetical protein